MFKITPFILDLVNSISSVKRENQGVWQYLRQSLYVGSENVANTKSTLDSADGILSCTWRESYND